MIGKHDHGAALSMTSHVQIVEEPVPDPASGQGTWPVLAPDEPPAVEIVNADGPSPIVLTCDHATNRVPRRYGSLGLSAAQLADHIAWDPGAAPVARAMATALDAPLVLSGYSRLVYDCNRPLRAASAVPVVSGGIPIPGNADLPSAERAARAAALQAPYQDAIAAVLDARAARGRSAVLVAIHSFTPDFPGQVRPWPIGLAYNRDDRLARALIDGLRRDDPSLVIGDNQPYKVDDESDYTIPVHGEARGLLHVLVEIRNDGVRTPTDQALWADRLCRALRHALPAFGLAA